MERIQKKQKLQKWKKQNKKYNECEDYYYCQKGQDC